MNDQTFRELLDSVKEGAAILRGDRPPARRTHLSAPDPLAIRQRLGLTRAEFARLLHVSERTVEGWEQGRRTPTGPARMLLHLTDRHPEVVLDAARHP